MHRLVDAQAFGVRPRQRAVGVVGKKRLRIESQELNEFRVRIRLDFGEQFRERITDPRNHHRPRLDATQAINPILERRQGEQVVQLKNAGFGAFALDCQPPRARLIQIGVFGRLVFLRPQFVKIVVGLRFFFGRRRGVDAIIRRRRAGKRGKRRRPPPRATAQTESAGDTASAAKNRRRSRASAAGVISEGLILGGCLISILLLLFRKRLSQVAASITKATAAFASTSRRRRAKQA